MEQAISACEGPFPNPVSHREGRPPIWVLGPRNRAPTCRTRTSTIIFLCLRPKDAPPSTHLLPFPPTWYNFLHVFLHMASALLPPSPTRHCCLMLSGKSLVKPQWFLRQSHPSAQMTLLHHLALCCLPSLDFPCSGFSFSLLLNIFQTLTAINLRPFIAPANPSCLPLDHCAVNPTSHQQHLSIASHHVLSRR